MHPFWLTFKDGSLEGRYLRSYYGSGSDTVLVFFSVAFFAASLWREYDERGLSGGIAWLAAHAALTTGMVATGAHLRRFEACKGYAHARILWSIFCRCGPSALCASVEAGSERR